MQISVSGVIIIKDDWRLTVVCSLFLVYVLHGLVGELSCVLN
jgi:hypothetical protein